MFAKGQFFYHFFFLQNETICSFCIRKQQTMLSWTPRCNCSVKKLYDEWQSCGLLANSAFPFKGDIHPEINLLPRDWIWFLLRWENAATWSTHIWVWFRHPWGIWNVESKQVFSSMSFINTFWLWAGRLHRNVRLLLLLPEVILTFTPTA